MVADAKSGFSLWSKLVSFLLGVDFHTVRFKQDRHLQRIHMHINQKLLSNKKIAALAHEFCLLYQSDEALHICFKL